MDISENTVALLKENKTEEAIQLLSEAIEKEPQNPIHYTNFGSILLQLKQYEEAERFFLKAIDCNRETATAFYGLGSLYYETSHYEEAEKMLQQTIRLGLEESDVYYLLGMVYVKKGNHLMALPFLQRATELDHDIEMLFQYGLALAKLNHLTEARKVFTQVIAKEAQHADALYNLGMIKLHNGENNEALAYMKRSLSANPRHQLARTIEQQLLAND